MSDLLGMVFGIENDVQRLIYLNGRGRSEQGEPTEMDIWLKRTLADVNDTLRALGVPETSFEPHRRRVTSPSVQAGGEDD